MKMDKNIIKTAFVGNKYQRQYASYIISKKNEQYQENLKNNKYALIKYTGK